MDLNLFILLLFFELLLIYHFINYKSIFLAGKVRKIKRRFYIDGYSYSLERRFGKKAYLRCSKTSSLRCKGRANYVIGENTVHVTSEHNHPKEYSSEIALNFIEQLKSASKSGFNSSIKDIYDGVANM